MTAKKKIIEGTHLSATRTRVDADTTRIRFTKLNADGMLPVFELAHGIDAEGREVLDVTFTAEKHCESAVLIAALIEAGLSRQSAYVRPLSTPVPGFLARHSHALQELASAALQARIHRIESTATEDREMLSEWLTSLSHRTP